MTLSSSSSINSVSAMQMSDIDDVENYNEPEQFEWFFNAGKANYKQGKYEEAIRAYQKALELDPSRAAKVYFALAFPYAELKEYDEVIKCYSEAIKADPKAAIYYNNRGVCYEHYMENLHEALQDYDEALKLEPDDVKALTNRARIYEKTAQYALAIKDIISCLVNHSNSNELKEIKNKILSETAEPNDCYSFALEFFQGKQYNDAIPFLNKAIELKPVFHEAYSLRAESYAHMQKNSEAKKDYDRAIELSPTEPSYYKLRAEFFVDKSLEYSDRKKLNELYEKAIADYDKVLKLNPADKESRLERARVFAIFNVEEAEKELSSLIEEFKEEYRLYIERASFMLRKQKFEEAVFDCQKALEINKDAKDAYIILAAAYGELGEYFAAEEVYEKAIDLEENEEERQKLETYKRRLISLGKRATGVSSKRTPEVHGIKSPTTEIRKKSSSAYSVKRGASSSSLNLISPDTASVSVSVDALQKVSKSNHQNSVKIKSYKKENLSIEETFQAFGVNQARALELLKKITPETKKLIMLAAEQVLSNPEFVECKLHYARHISRRPVDEVSVAPVYVDYISKKNKNSEWPHPGVLQALAHKQKIRLRIWQVDKDNQLIPYQKRELADNKLAAAEKTLDLLLTCDAQLKINKLEIIKITDQALNEAASQDSSSLESVGELASNATVQDVAQHLVEIQHMTMQDVTEEVISANQIPEEEDNVVPPPAKKKKIENSVDDKFRELIECKISHRIMIDPVIASDGHTYEREEIEEVIRYSSISPITRERIGGVIPNKDLKKAILEYLEGHNELPEDVYFSKKLQQQAFESVRECNLEQLKDLIQRDKRLLNEKLEVKGEQTALLIYFICKYGDANQLEFVLNERSRLGISPQLKDIKYYVEAIYQNTKLKQHMQSILNQMNWSPQEYNELLWWAIENGNADDVVEWCVGRVTDINFSDARGRTYLHRAVQLSRSAIVRLLLAKNINVLSQDEKGRTALHYTVNTGYKDIARLILLYCQERAINFDIQDSEGKTPGKFAEDQGSELVNLFEEFSHKDYTPQMHWVKNFSLFYKKEKFEISGDCHDKELRTERETMQKSEGNVVTWRIRFLFKLKDEKYKEEPYKSCCFLPDPMSGKLHVDKVYDLSTNDFMLDLKRYHADRTRTKLIDEKYQDYKENKSQSFTRLFHHSERATFKYFEGEKVIKEYADKLACEIQKQYELNPNQVRVIAVILDMNSTRYLCNFCEDATHYFQNPQSLFMVRLKKELERLEFILPKKHDLYMITRYSAEMPSRDDDCPKTEAQHEGAHIRYDIDDMRTKKFSLILQRDNLTVIGENRNVGSFSRKNQASSMNSNRR